MKDNEDSPSNAAPMLKLSRVSRKPRKRIAETDAPKPKKRRARKRTDVPIPSFSPVHNLDEMDISILDSPVKPKEEPLVVLLNEENDDDDDDLLDAPPTFAPTQPSKSSQTIDKKPNISLKKNGTSADEQQNQKSRDTATSEPEQKLDTDKLPEEAKQTIAQVDTTVEIKQDASRNAHEPVKKKKAAKKHKIKPDEADLIVAIDGLFVQANADDTTEKDFVEALEGQYGAKLYKTSKTFARTRLKALIQGTIEATVSFSPPPGAAGVLKDAPKLEEQKDEADRECNDGSDNVFAFEDEDGAPATTSIQVATKKQEVEPTKSTEEQVVASPEKTLPKAKPKRRGRAPKKASDVEAVTGMDESESSAGSAKQRKPVAEKPVPKKKAAPPKKPRAPRAKKGTCALCTTCTCTIGKETNVVDASAVMSRTDAEIERALIRRTQKLERVVDKYETLLDQVHRELKKHRRNVLKKQEAQLNDGKRLAFGESRFLPDASVWDEQAQAVDCVALPTPVVEEAQETLFANGDCQITLTQMFGGGSKEKGENTDRDDTTKEDNAHSQTVTDEDKEDVVDDASVVDDDMELEPEPDPVDHIHRVSWRKGALLERQTPSCQAPGAWSALTTNIKVGRSPQSPASKFGNVSLPTSISKYDCAWDALFAADVTDDSNGDDSRINQLLDLFENEMSNETQREIFTQESQFEAPLLSQRGENIAGSIEDSIASDPTQLQSIKAACPKWRDNIRFALAHKGEAEIRQALERVQRSMQALQATKEKVSTVWNRQEVVLKLFELSLLASLSRLDRPEEESLQSASTKETTDDKAASSITQGKTSSTSRLSPVIECDEGISQSSQQ